MRSNWTKKALLVGVAVFLLISASACGSAQESSGSAANSSEENGETTSNSSEVVNAESITWVHQSLLNPGHMNTDAELYFAEEVEKRTDGRIKFDIYTGGGFGIKDAEVLSAVGDGLMQSAQMYGSHVAGDLKITEIMELPFLIPYDIELRKKITDALFPYWEKEMIEKFNTIPLAVNQVEARNIYTTKEVVTLEDLKGMKIRSQGPVETELTNAMGATATPVAWNDIYTALQQGVIDGYWVTNSSTVTSKFYEVVDYAWEVGTSGATWFLMVNKDAFGALSEDDQQIVREVAIEAEKIAWDRVISDDEKFKALLQENGMTFHQASEEDIAKIKEVAQPIIDKWLEEAGPLGQEMMEIINQILEEQGY